MVDVTDTLKERGKRYGEFKAHAEITQALKAVMQKTPGWDRLSASQKESLEMQAHKVGRILNGDPNYDDSWLDIAGYATLVVDELREPAFIGATNAADVTVGEARVRRAKLDARTSIDNFAGLDLGSAAPAAPVAPVAPVDEVRDE